MKGKKLRHVLIALLALFLLLAVGAFVFFSHFAAKIRYASAEELAPAADAAAAAQAFREDAEAGGADGLSVEEQAAIDRQLADNLEAGSDWDFSGKNVTNFLLIGVDNSYLPGMDQLGNADGLVILSINKDTKQLVMSSLMRDIYVSVPGEFNTKITLSYHYGGVPMLLSAVESNFGIPIDNYVLVNYPNVVELVDTVGGLDLTLSESEIYHMRGKIKNVNYLLGLPEEANALTAGQAGKVHLNGVQVAAYLRVRMAGNNDFERTERARRVLSLLLEKARGMSFRELNAVADLILPGIVTDLGQGQILSLLLGAPQYLRYEIVSNRIPVDDSFYFANIRGSVIVIDYAVNREFLYRSIYEGVS